MIPIILVSDTVRKAENYISEFKKRNHIQDSKTLRYSPEKAIITIDQIREIQNIAARLRNNEIVIIYDFETAKKESQNAFLKTLEEYSQNAIFFLVVKSYTSILETILSRTRIVRLFTEKKGAQTKRKVIFDIHNFTFLEEAMNATSMIKKDQFIRAFDDVVLSLYEDLNADVKGITSKKDVQEIAQAISAILEIKGMVISNNLNSEYSLDQALIHVARVVDWSD